MSNQLLIDLADNIKDSLEEIDEKIESSRAEAEESRGDIDQARDMLSNAYDEAERAEDRAIEATQLLNNVKATLEELSTKLQGDELTGLDADIARNKADVLRLHKAGHGIAAIAKHKKISESLVDIIIRRNLAAA